jgi:hypothetical protein
VENYRVIVELVRRCGDEIEPCGTDRANDGPRTFFWDDKNWWAREG